MNLRVFETGNVSRYLSSLHSIRRNVGCSLALKAEIPLIGSPVTHRAIVFYGPLVLFLFRSTVMPISSRSVLSVLWHPQEQGGPPSTLAERSFMTAEGGARFPEEEK